MEVYLTKRTNAREIISFISINRKPGEVTGLDRDRQSAAGDDQPAAREEADEQKADSAEQQGQPQGARTGHGGGAGRRRIQVHRFDHLHVVEEGDDAVDGGDHGQPDRAGF